MLQNDRSLCRQQQVLEIPCYICGLQAWGETFAFLNLCWRQGMGAQGATVLMDFLFSAWVGISVRWHGKQMSGAVGRRVWGAGLWVYLATDSFPVNLWPFTHVFCRGGGEIKSYKTKFCAYSSVNTEKKCFCMQKALKVPSSSNCSVQLFFFFLISESFHFDSGGCTKQKCWYHFFSVPVLVQITFSPEVTIKLGFGLNACVVACP